MGPAPQQAPAPRPARSIVHIATFDDVVRYAMPGGLGGRGGVRGETPPLLTSVTPVTYADFRQYDPPVVVQANSSTGSFTPSMKIREGGPGGTELATTYVNASTLQATTLGAHRTASVFRSSGNKNFDVCLPGGANASNAVTANVLAYADPGLTGSFGSQPADTQRSGANVTAWGTGGGALTVSTAAGTVTYNDNDAEVGGADTTLTMTLGSFTNGSLFNYLVTHTTYTFLAAWKPGNNPSSTAMSEHSIGTWNIGVQNGNQFFHQGGNTTLTQNNYTPNQWHVLIGSTASDGVLRICSVRAGTAPVATSTATNFSGYPGLGGSGLRVCVNPVAMVGKFLRYEIYNFGPSERQNFHFVNRICVMYPTPFSF